MILNAYSNRPAIRQRLKEHPRVQSVGSGDKAMDWHQGDWHRTIRMGIRTAPLYGLLELMDNNPLVCADEFSVPSPAATIALIALGPLAAAGLIVEKPTMILNIPAEVAEIDEALSDLGWDGGLILTTEELSLGSVIAGTIMVEIETPPDIQDIDDIFEERYGKSFFVRKDEDSTWDPHLVEGLPYALYRLIIATDSPRSLLTIRVLADAAGKCGAAQVVHAMNVMCGFEESLGIS